MSKINKNAIGSYTASAYPNLFKLVGAAGLAKIQKHDRMAARLISKLSECDEVVYVGYSTRLSVPPDTVASFVNCKNGKRFYAVNGAIQK